MAWIGLLDADGARWSERGLGGAAAAGLRPGPLAAGTILIETRALGLGGRPANRLRHARQDPRPFGFTLRQDRGASSPG
jgi:hypothetical protein